MCVARTLIFSIFVIFVECFNLNEKPLFTFEGDDESFGRAVLMQKGAPSRVLVGAPLHNYTGTFYDCSFSSSRCEDLKKNLGISLSDSLNLGATLDGDISVSNTHIVCAPKYLFVGSEDQFTNGICFKKDGRNGYSTIDPFKDQSQLGNSGQFYFAMGQFGHALNYFNESISLFGAPGYLLWKGTTVQENFYANSAIIDYRTGATGNHAYFGYSITSGRFDDKVLYAVGAPRYEYEGKVEVFLLGDKVNRIQTIKNNYLHKFGSYFGYSLGVARLTSKENQLLVSAPTYSKSRYFDEGMVFVYSYQNGVFGKPFTLDGHDCPGRRSPGSRFGTSIANLGPIFEGDGYDRVAISAPYENNGKGAIYIYVGGPKEPKCSQRIVGEKLGLHNLGLSLSKSVDIDDNHLDDFAVGSRGSVSVLTSKSVVKVQGKITTDIKLLYRNSTLIPYSYCLTVTALEGVDSVEVDVRIRTDGRAVGGTYHVKKTIATNEEHCYDREVTLKENNQNFNMFPITFYYDIMDEALAIDPASPSSKQIHIPFITDCGPDNICQSNLKLSAYFNKKELIIGSEDTIALIIEVSNLGEPAYGCELHFPLPKGVIYQKCPSNCVCRNEAMMCKVANPLHANKTLKFLLNIHKLSTKVDKIEIPVSTSIATEQNVISTVAELALKVRYDIQISSKEPQQHVVGPGINKMIFSHIYEINNKGPSPLEDYKITLLVPHIVAKNGTKILGLDLNMNKNITCPSLPTGTREISKKTNDYFNQTENMIIINCPNAYCVNCFYSGDKLEKSKSKILMLNFTSDIDGLIEYFKEDLKTKDILMVTSQIKIENITEYHTSAEIIHLKVDRYIAWWIYALGISLGLFLLILILIALYLCHFFKRKRIMNSMTESASLRSGEDH